MANFEPHSCHWCSRLTLPAPTLQMSSVQYVFPEFTLDDAQKAKAPDTPKETACEFFKWILEPLFSEDKAWLREADTEVLQKFQLYCQFGAREATDGRPVIDEFGFQHREEEQQQRCRRICRLVLYSTYHTKQSLLQMPRISAD